MSAPLAVVHSSFPVEGGDADGDDDDDDDDDGDDDDDDDDDNDDDDDDGDDDDDDDELRRPIMEKCLPIGIVREYEITCALLENA